MQRMVLMRPALFGIGVAKFEKALNDLLAAGWQLDVGIKTPTHYNGVAVHGFGWHRILMVAHLSKEDSPNAANGNAS